MPKGQIELDWIKMELLMKLQGNSSLTWCFITWNAVPIYLYEHC